MKTWLFFILSASICTLHAQEILIHAGRVIDGQSNQVMTERTITVEGNKITAIRSGYASPRGDQTLVDLKDYTVMPGLMDMHTHLSNQSSPQSYSEAFRLNPADYAFRMVGYARKTLMAGFTTVRDLGDRYNLTVSLRNAVAQGLVDGPRIYTAGKSIATTGGHADPTNGLNDLLKGDPGPREGVVNSPEEARKAVRQRYKDGSDLIKITATGGVLSMAKSGQNPQFSMPELEAIIAAAKDYDFIVAAHAHGTEGMKRAVLAGVTSIEHGTYMTEEVMDLMIERGTYLVPTLLAGDFVATKAKEPGYYPPVVAAKAAAIGPVMIDTFAKAYKRGVKIAFGTDCGVSPHGENAKEFELMVQGGMPPMEVIQSATRVAAEMLRIDGQVGTLETGKWADIVAVKGNPIENIALLNSVAFVMKDGKVFKQP